MKNVLTIQTKTVRIPQVKKWIQLVARSHSLNTIVINYSGTFLAIGTR